MSGSQGVCELLGYPPDARLLIVNADDFGMCHGQNEGTMRANKGGLATSCSLMVPAPWCGHAVHLLKENPQIPFGLHLTLVSEYVHYRWKPVAPSNTVPSLLDESGHFPTDDRFAQHLMHADLGDVEREFRAQIEAALAAGLKPTHLDSHYHTHELREDFFEMTVELAIEYGVALRVGHRSRAESLLARGLPAPDQGVLDCGRYPPGELGSVLAKALRELPCGLSEWGLHPGVVTDELKAVMAHPLVDGVTGTPEGRRATLNFVTSEEARAIVSEEGIELLSYEPLQRLWAAHRRG
jgi:hypothetical protein